MQDETNTQICQTKHYEVAGMLSLAELHWETMHYTKKKKKNLLLNYIQG